MGDTIIPLKSISTLDTLTFHKMFDKWVAQPIIRCTQTSNK